MIFIVEIPQHEKMGCDRTIQNVPEIFVGLCPMKMKVMSIERWTDETGETLRNGQPKDVNENIVG